MICHRHLADRLSFMDLTSISLSLFLVDCRIKWTGTLTHPKASFGPALELSRSPRPRVFASTVSKVKVFGWLLLIDRLNTYDMLDRRHCSPENASLSCVLCSTGMRETTLHLFFQCPFSSECWAQFGVIWDSSLSFGEMLFAAKNSYVFTLCWEGALCCLEYLEAKELFNFE